jgi:hypothetical protein
MTGSAQSGKEHRQPTVSPDFAPLHPGYEVNLLIVTLAIFPNDSEKVIPRIAMAQTG